MTAHAFNLAVLDNALAYIEAHPDEWDQTRWFSRRDCGTAMCLAGTIVWQAGWKPFDWQYDDVNVARVQITGHVAKDGQERYVAGLAAELLGLDYQTADDLFETTNTLDRLRAIRDELAGGAA